MHYNCILKVYTDNVIAQKMAQLFTKRETISRMQLGISFLARKTVFQGDLFKNCVVHIYNIGNSRLCFIL
jgi:phage tail sheath gpL-like